MKRPATATSAGERSSPDSRSPRRRLIMLAAVVLIGAAGVAGYARYAALRTQAPATVGDEVAPAAPLAALPDAGAAAPARPYVLFRDSVLGPTYGHVGLEYLDDLGGARFVSPLVCDRVDVAAGRGICLQANRRMLTTYHARVFDSRFQVLHSQALAGPPSRARLSSDGRLAAMTVFLSGHSYATPGFTTRTSILDTSSGQWIVDDRETLEVVRAGAVFKAADFNFWGVSFTRDNRRFYATLQTAGQFLLVEGEIATRRMRVLHANVECPSLSPDNKRIAFKRRVPLDSGGRFVWRLHVLDLASGRETALPLEKRSIDDQVEWLSDEEVAYGLPDDAPQAGAAIHTWALRVDGSEAPRLLVRRASSPAVVS